MVIARICKCQYLGGHASNQTLQGTPNKLCWSNGNLSLERDTALFSSYLVALFGVEGIVSLG